MPESFVAWVDYSAAEQEKMRQAIALFKETETRDELGLGVIRDILADLLFPGTSTIQTRLRYFLIVPWVYRELVGLRRITTANVAQNVRKQELDLIDPLKASGNEGVFGAVSGRTIKRRPSSVYWNGLRTWGIFRGSWSREEYHRHWDDIRTHNQEVIVADDTGIAPARVQVWDRLPSPPPDWTTTLSLELSRPEADYLRARMESCRGSLLAHLATQGRPDLEAPTPWAATDNLPPKLSRLVRQAQGLSLAMRGAPLLYSLDLCEREQNSEKADMHRERLAAWARDVAPFLQTWSPAELWAYLAEAGLGIPPGRLDRRFVDDWFACVREIGVGNIANNAGARRLVEQRERHVKGHARSRYANAQARARWSGDSGTAPIDYRWLRVRILLRDLYAGLDR